MKVEVNEEHEIVLKEVYSDVVLETEEGNKLYVCMRDNTFELFVQPKDVYGTSYRINMENRNIEKL